MNAGQLADLAMEINDKETYLNSLKEKFIKEMESIGYLLIRNTHLTYSKDKQSKRIHSYHWLDEETGKESKSYTDEYSALTAYALEEIEWKSP